MGKNPRLKKPKKQNKTKQKNREQLFMSGRFIYKGCRKKRRKQYNFLKKIENTEANKDD